MRIELRIVALYEKERSLHSTSMKENACKEEFMYEEEMDCSGDIVSIFIDRCADSGHGAECHGDAADLSGHIEWL